MSSRAVFKDLAFAARASLSGFAQELAFAPFALLFSWGLFAVPGVPKTFDGLGLVFIETYRRAYLAGEWFPLWTPFAERGHGSAIPILYHRLHSQLAGLVALETDTVTALKLSIPAMLFVGAVGMRRLCRSQGVRPWVAWLAGVLLISSNYVVTDWFVRGATSELLAFMLVPWGFRYALELFERRWGAVRLAVASILIFYAHMLTFYFFALVTAVVIVGALLELRSSGMARLRPAVGRLAVFGAMVTCAIGPYAAAVLYTAEWCGVGELGMRGDAEAYQPWGACFTDRCFSWTRAVIFSELSVEIGRWCLLTLAVLLLLAPAARRAIWQRAGGLAIVAVCFVLLQRYDMAFWFRLVPGASKVQFPSRLLVDVVTIMLLCLALSVEWALRSTIPFVRLAARVLPIVSAGWQGNMAVGAQSAIWGNHIERDAADELLAREDEVTSGGFSVFTTWSVFLPKAHGGDPPQQPFLEASDGCTVSLPTASPAREVRGNLPLNDLDFAVFGDHCTVKMNQFQSALLRVELSDPSGSARKAPDGTTLIDAPSDGTVVHVRERSVMDLAKKWLIEKGTRRP